MIPTRFLSLLLTASALFAQAPAPAGPSYLLMSHDPAFLEEVAKVSAVTYSAGRTRVVKLTVPFAGLPGEIAAKLREVSPEEIHNGPAAPGPGKTADPAVLAITLKADGARLMGYADAITMAGKRSAAQLDLSAASGNRLAGDYIAGVFKDLGYAVERQCYKDRKADKECNIVARRAAGQGAKTILIIGHMDSMGYEKAGADDNASGAAGVKLETLRSSAFSLQPWRAGPLPSPFVFTEKRRSRLRQEGGRALFLPS